MLAPPANCEGNVVLRSPRRRTRVKGVEVVGRDTPSPLPSSPTPTGYPPPPPRRAGPRSGTHTPTVLPHPDAVSMVGPGWEPPRQFTTQNRQATHHHHPVIPNPDPVPTPQPSYRTPMRYPWWGPGGDPFGNSPRKTDRRPTTTTSSSPTPSRYPHPNRLTAPRCGIHGGARVGTPSAIHHAKPTGVTTTTTSSSPTPSRYPHPNRLTAPRCGIHGGARVGTPSAIHHAKPTGVTTTNVVSAPPSVTPICHPERPNCHSERSRGI